MHLMWPSQRMSRRKPAQELPHESHRPSLRWPASKPVKSTDFTAAPLRLTKTFTVDASPTEVWALIGDHPKIPLYFPMVTKVAVDNRNASMPEGEGAVRRCDWTGMGPLTEDIVVYRPGKALGYQVRAGNPMGLADHFALVTLKETRSGGTTLTWQQYFNHPTPAPISAKLGGIIG